MRTFHTGGVAGPDITTGLPRVEELFEARVPKGKAGSATSTASVAILRGRHGHPGRSRLSYDSALDCRKAPSCWPRPATPSSSPGRRRVDAGARDHRAGRRLPGQGRRPRLILAEDARARVRRPAHARLRVEDGEEVRAGEQLTDGPINPQEFLGPGAGSRAALPGRGSPEGLPQPGCQHQRQAHRDHRPADAPQGPYRPAGRHRAAAG